MNAHRLCFRCGEPLEQEFDHDASCPHCGHVRAPDGAAPHDEDASFFDDVLPPIEEAPARTRVDGATRQRSLGVDQRKPIDASQETNDELPLLVDSAQDSERDVPSPFGKARHKKERAPTHRPLPPAVRKPIVERPIEDPTPLSSKPSVSHRDARSSQSLGVHHAVTNRKLANHSVTNHRSENRNRSDASLPNEAGNEHRANMAGRPASGDGANQQPAHQVLDNTARAEPSTPVAPALPTSLVVAAVFGVAAMLGALLWNQFQPSRAKLGSARTVQAIRATSGSDTTDLDRSTSSTTSLEDNVDSTNRVPSQTPPGSAASIVPPNNPFVDEPDKPSIEGDSAADSSFDRVLEHDGPAPTNKVNVDTQNVVVRDAVVASADAPNPAMTSRENGVTAASRNNHTAPPRLDESIAGAFSETTSGDSNRLDERVTPLEADPAAARESRGQLTNRPATLDPDLASSPELDVDPVSSPPERSASEPTTSSPPSSKQAESELVRVAASVSIPNTVAQAAQAGDSVSRDRNISAAAARPSVDRAITIPTQLPAELVPTVSEPRANIDMPLYTGEQLQRSLRLARDSLVRLNANPNASRVDRMNYARDLYRRLCEVGQCVAYIDTDDRRLGQRMEATDALLMRIASSESLTHLIGRTATSWLRFNDRPNNGIALAGRVSSIRAVGDYFETELQLLSRPETSLRVVSHVTPQLDPRVPFEVGAELVVLGALIERAEELPGYSGELPVIYRGHHVVVTPQ